MKNKFTRILLALLMFISINLTAGQPATTTFVAAPADLTLSRTSITAADSTTWTLIYSDSSLKVYYTDIVCETANAVRLKMENLGSSQLSFTYKIWTASPFAKSVTLQGSQTLEGICSTVYNNLLVEAIPTGSDVNNINVQITY
jgi:hypothetical protein